MIKIPEWITNLKPYIPGKPIGELAREKSLKRIVKVASNENPLGPSPLAIKALIENLSDAHRYVDREAPDLVAKIAGKFGKNPDQIICGHGVDALLGYIICAFTRENDEVLTSEGTFIGIYVNTRKLGREISQVPLNNYAYDLEAILSSVSPRTKVIYLANPNNPTGTIFTKSRFEAFIEKVPEHILVILDEAYTEFASRNPDFPNGLEYDYDNLIVTRTLSKTYGLAGLRVGFAAGPKNVINELYKVKLPFEPNYAAQIAALAALDDDEFVKKTVEINDRSLKRISAGFDKIGIEYVESHANFLLMLLPSEKFAESFNEECLNSGLILRHVKPFGIPNGIRINSASDDETDFALEVIGKVYRKLTQINPT
jgi:histidinol-phosphate aminotransferase